MVGSNMDKIYIVMDYVEHDMKGLMETMKDPFMIGTSTHLKMFIVLGVLQRKIKFQKFEITMKVDGLVQVSL